MAGSPDERRPLEITLADLAEIGLAAPFPELYRSMGTMAAFEAGKRAAANAIITSLLLSYGASNAQNAAPLRRRKRRGHRAPQHPHFPFPPLAAEETSMSDLQTKPVIVRTYSAGVHFGYLAGREGKEVTLERSRRIWRWYGANTLSEIATAGLDNGRSRVAAPVSIVLTEAIEIIDCTPEAVAKIEAATWAP